MDDDVADQTEREYSGEDVEQDYTGGTQASWDERGLSNEDFDNSVSGEMDLSEEGDEIADALLNLGKGNLEGKVVTDSFIGNADLITSETNEEERFSHLSEGVRKAAIEVLKAQTQYLSGKALVAAKASYEAALGKSSDQFIKNLDVQATSPVTTLDPTAFSMKAVMKDGKIVYRAKQDRIKPYRDSFIAQALSNGYDTKEEVDPIVLDSGYSITGNVEQGIGKSEREELKEIFSQTELINQPNIIGSFEPKASKQDVMVARSMLESVESYEARGPGSQVAGNYNANVKHGPSGTIEGFYDEAFDKNSEEDKKLNKGSKDKRIKADQDFALAMSNISDLAELYIDPRAKGGEMYGKQKSAVEAALTQRFLDGQMSDEAKSILPLPNETGVTGLRVTRGSVGGQQGTPFTRLEFGLEANKRGWTPEGKDLKEGEENPYWRYLGTVGQSLFPKKFVKDEFGEEDVEANALNTRTRKYEEQVALDKARATRKILLEQMPTLRDETAGQSRTPGFDRPYGDQENTQHILDKAFGSGADLKEFTGDDGSETKEAIEAGYEAAERERNLPMKDFVGPNNLEGIEQRTPAWYKARQDLITASKLTNTSGQLQDAEGMAAQLALEKYAKTDPELAKEIEYIGSSHTVDGQKGEELALKEFLMMQKTEGDELTHTEVGLLQSEEMPGFGASPDGRLRDSEDNNRGLLELKYLTTGSMKGALKKYTPQMQLQMAVTGETETNFFALDKYTGESIHEVVKADPDMQAEILEEGKLALELSQTLTKEEAKEMKKQTKAQRRKSNLEEKNETGKGQEESYEPVDYKEKEMTTFSAKDVNKSHKKTFEQDKAKAIKRDFESVAAMKEFDQTITDATEATKKDVASDKASAKSTKERERADKDAARAVNELKDAAAEAASGLLALALSSKDSAMDTINLAKTSGFGTVAEIAEVRGQEFAMQAGGLDKSVAKQVIADSGDTMQKLMGDTTAGAEILRMTKRYADNRELSEQLGPMKSPNEILEMGVDLAPFVQGEMNKLEVGSPLRVAAAEAYGYDKKFAASTATMEEMRTERSINVEGTKDFDSAYTTFEMYLRANEEDLTALSGAGGGVATAAGEEAKKKAKMLVFIKNNPIISMGAVAAGALSAALYNEITGNDYDQEKKKVAKPSSNYLDLLEKAGKPLDSVEDNTPKRDLSKPYEDLSGPNKKADTVGPIEASRSDSNVETTIPVDTNRPYSEGDIVGPVDASRTSPDVVSSVEATRGDSKLDTTVPIDTSRPDRAADTTIPIDTNKQSGKAETVGPVDASRTLPIDPDVVPSSTVNKNIKSSVTFQSLMDKATKGNLDSKSPEAKPPEDQIQVLGIDVPELTSTSKDVPEPENKMTPVLEYFPVDYVEEKKLPSILPNSKSNANSKPDTVPPLSFKSPLPNPEIVKDEPISINNINHNYNNVEVVVNNSQDSMKVAANVNGDDTYVTQNREIGNSA